MKQKPIFMGSTKVDPLKTVSEIMAILVASGARQIASDYDAAGKVCGLRFVIEAQGKQLAFALPVRTEALLKRLRNDRAQSERVAWRQLLRWVQAQLAMIEVGMVRAEEVYMPYLLEPSGKTLYETMWESKFKALNAGN